MSAEVGKVKYRVEFDDSDIDKEVGKTESKISSKFGSAAKGLAGAVGAAAVGAAAAGTAAIGGLVKSATEAYGEYEQLAGGVETLFGDSADAVKKHAEDAYKTAGMSANDYLSTVTSFSASLIQSTGRGAQTNLDELEASLKDSYTATKRAYDDEYEAAKKAWADRIALAKEGGKVNTDELKAQRDAEVKSLQASQKQQLEATKKAWADQIAAAKEAGATNLDELKAQRDAEIAALKQSNSDALDALKASHKEKIDSTKAAGKESTDASIEALKKQRDEELKALKRSNEDQLTALKAANKDKLDEAERANQSSTTSAESLAKASELADQAIIDMSDNANKMGTDIAAIQNAYSGFAKGNFTMLDNLKLGYGGTKEEMERLLADAEAISGVEYDLSSYADIVEAIHVVQEEMGITGTTAKEAGDTLQGSLSQMQAAWTNLTAGLANPDADIGKLVGDMVESAKTFLANLVPILSQALEGIALAVAELAPVMAKELPGLFEKTLPVLLEAGVECIKALAEGIIKAIPTLMPTITRLVLDLVKMLIEMLPDIIEAGLQVILALAMGIAEALPDLIPTIVDVVLTIVEALIDNVDLLIDASIALIIGLAEGLINALPKLIEKAPVIVEKLIQAVIRNAPKIGLAAIQLVLELVKGILANLPKFVEAGWNIISSVIKGIDDTMRMLPEYGKQVINKIWDGIKTLDPLQWGKDLIQSFIDGIMGMISSVGDAVGRVADTVKSFLGFSEPEKGPLSNFHTFPKDMVDLYAQGIEDNAYKVADAAEGLAGDIAMGFNSDINYNVPDLAGYAADLSASITGTGQTRIEVPVVIDGREVARASAWYMGEQLAWEAR